MRACFASENSESPDSEVEEHEVLVSPSGTVSVSSDVDA